MGQAVLYAPPLGEASSSTVALRQAGGDSLLTLARRASHGWVTWYWEEGLHLLLWQRRPDGGVIGAEVERVALLASILGRLPPTKDEGAILLKDAKGDTVYEWGGIDVDGARRPSARFGLRYPLDFLELEYFAPVRPEAALAGSLELGLFFGLGAILVSLAVLAAYFYREWSRDLREAAQRVRFVTQVSHELKTPLTNIRLYAELLESELPEEESNAARRLGVIVSESQRLTRLINNILSFSKQRQNKLEIQKAPIQIDSIIESTIAQFSPLLEAKGMAVTLALAAKAPISADADALGQILANLVSNVEKYAVSGGALLIESTQERGRTEVTIKDKGPGIAAEHREKIFAPFYRVSDKLTDGVTGTGIGLTIARDLARLHGGDLVLLSGEGGAAFRLTLNQAVIGGAA
jgi:signal transduction histidine kinase